MKKQTKHPKRLDLWLAAINAMRPRVSQQVLSTQPQCDNLDEPARALELATFRQCPHCNQAVPLSDAISMVQGSGWERWVHVQMPDGRVVPVRTADVNPQTMRVIE